MLTLLQVLHLLLVSLLQLLCLLLVALLRLLHSRFGSIALRQTLVFLFLLLLEPLPLLVLPGKQPVLLLLIFPVAVLVSGVGRSGTLKRPQVAGMRRRP